MRRSQASPRSPVYRRLATAAALCMTWTVVVVGCFDWDGGYADDCRGHGCPENDGGAGGTDGGSETDGGAAPPSDAGTGADAGTEPPDGGATGSDGGQDGGDATDGGPDAEDAGATPDAGAARDAGELGDACDPLAPFGADGGIAFEADGGSPFAATLVRWTVDAGATAGASREYSAYYPPSSLIDGQLGTSWYADSAACAFQLTDWYCCQAPLLVTVGLPAERPVSGIELRGNRDYSDYWVLRARLELLSDQGAVVSAFEVAPSGPLRDYAVSLPAPVRARELRLRVLVGGRSGPGLAEVSLWGPPE